MALEKVIKIVADTQQATKNLDDVNSILNEQRDILIVLEKELIKAENIRKETSKSNLAGQKRATEQVNHLKDAIKDQKLALRSLNIDRRKATKDLKDLNDTTEISSGSFKILDQLTGGLASKVKEGYKATKLFNKALKGTKTALLATGIGAVVIALSAIVLYWDEIKEAIKGTNKKLKEQIDLSIKVQASLKLRVDLIDKQIALNEKLGKGNEALQKQRIELVKQIREANKAEIEGLTLQNEKLKTSALELSTREKILKTVLNTINRGSGDSFILDGQLESLKKYKETQDLITKAKSEQVDLDIKIFDLQNPEVKKTIKPAKTKENIPKDDVKNIDDEINERLEYLQKIEDAENEFFKSKLSEESREEIATREKYFNLIEQAKIYGEDTLILEDAQRKALKEISDKYDKEEEDTKIANEKAKAEAINKIRNANLDNAVAGISLLKQVGEKNKAIQAAAVVAENAVGVAKTIINTQSANAAVTAKYALLPGGLALATAEKTANNISAGISIASSVLATKKALSELGGGGSAGGGGGLPSGGGGGQSAPSFNLVQGTGTNQIAQGLQSQNEPVQAFVVSSSVTSAQELDRNTIDEASI